MKLEGSGERLTIRPVSDTTLSSRRASTWAKSADDTSITHWVTP